MYGEGGLMDLLLTALRPYDTETDVGGSMGGEHVPWYKELANSNNAWEQQQIMRGQFGGGVRLPEGGPNPFEMLASAFSGGGGRSPASGYPDPQLIEVEQRYAEWCELKDAVVEEWSISSWPWRPLRPSHENAEPTYECLLSRYDQSTSDLLMAFAKQLDVLVSLSFADLSRRRNLRALVDSAGAGSELARLASLLEARLRLLRSRKALAAAWHEAYEEFWKLLPTDTFDVVSDLLDRLADSEERSDYFDEYNALCEAHNGLCDEVRAHTFDALPAAWNSDDDSDMSSVIRIAQGHVTEGVRILSRKLDSIHSRVLKRLEQESLAQALSNTPVRSASTSIADELLKLKALLDQGVIDEDEFRAMKARAIDG